MMNAPGLPEKHACTIQQWVAGRQNNRQEINQEQARHVGTLIARLHQAGRAFGKRKGFVRPRWDLDGLRGGALNIKPELVRTSLSSEQCEILDIVADEVHAVMLHLGEDKDAVGLIQGNPQAQHMHFGENDVVAVDFDLCGWGYYMYDLAIFMHDLKERPDFSLLKGALIEGYRSIHPLPEEQLRQLNKFMTGYSMFQIYRLANNLHQPAFKSKAATQLEEHFAFLNLSLNSDPE